MLKKIISKIKNNFLCKKLSSEYAHLQFVQDFKIFKKRGGKRFELDWENRYPCLNDKTKNTKFDAHYIYHPAWAARILAKTKPKDHIDISSTLHFCSIVSAFIPVKFYDYRLANLHLSNLTSEKANLLSLPFTNNSINSLSCMHTVEHIGLGRYGDPLDPEGDLRAIDELKRVLAKNGDLLFVVPIGKSKIQFNAHRVYSYNQIMEYFQDLKLVEFSLIPDNALDVWLINNATQEQADKQNYGCGCFWFKK